MRGKPTPIPSSGDPEARFRATPHDLHFTAQMDRACSWWNPEDLDLPRDYILRHEQIYFAIVELGARALNAEVAGMQRRPVVSAEARGAAIAEIERLFDREVERLMAELLTRSRHSDEDTSMGHRPAQQDRWWREIQKELAAGPATPSTVR